MRKPLGGTCRRIRSRDCGDDVHIFVTLRGSEDGAEGTGQIVFVVFYSLFAFLGVS